MTRAVDALVATPARRTALAVAALAALLLVPFLGNYGAWDPWETHYGEVARQMLARNDFISLWWPGSPIDHPPRGEFWSKPVLTFWLEALSLKLAGLEWSGARPDELVTSWRAEWALRVPSMLLSAAALAFVFTTVRKLVSRRAAALAALVLVTSPEWLLIARQAMTDMAFVAPMTIALCLAAQALLVPDEDELPRRRLGPISFARAPAFYGLVALYVLSTLTQLVVFSVQLRFRPPGWHATLPGVVAMLPWFACFFAGLFFAARAKRKSQLLLLSAWLLSALATLAKGPAGVALPAITIGLFLVSSGRFRDFLRLEIFGGVLAFAACAAPWWHAMLLRHGRPFWQELFGDNYVNRAAGRNGDRGAFEYYLGWVGYGMFPWSGVTAVATLTAFLRPKTARQALVRFCLVWALVDLTTISLVNTKYHHYSLPALPALAILAGVFLDDVLAAPARCHAYALALLGLPLTIACGRDLAAYPPRFLWMFDYDYVLVPNIGRPWPEGASYGHAYEYGAALFTFVVAAALALTAVIVAIGRRASSAPDENEAPPARAKVLALFAAFAVALAAAVALGPSTDGAAPPLVPWRWLGPAALALGALALVAWMTRAGAAALLGAVAVVVSAFLADRYVPELGPHWSQKHVIASYYKHRSGPDEPLIVYNLYWRGENFYTRNEVYSQPEPSERWAWVEPQNIQPQAWLQKHRGQRIFVLVERNKLETVRGLLPAGARDLTIVDDSNNKLVLVAIRI